MPHPLSRVPIHRGNSPHTRRGNTSVTKPITKSTVTPSYAVKLHLRRRNMVFGRSILTPAERESIALYRSNRSCNESVVSDDWDSSPMVTFYTEERCARIKEERRNSRGSVSMSGFHKKSVDGRFSLSSNTRRSVDLRPTSSYAPSSVRSSAGGSESVASHSVGSYGRRRPRFSLPATVSHWLHLGRRPRKP